MHTAGWLVTQSGRTGNYVETGNEDQKKC